MDLVLGFQDEIDQAEPSGYAQENPAFTHTPQLRAGVRYRWPLHSGLFAFAEGDATVGLWPQRFDASDMGATARLLTLPAIQLALNLGLGWHFF